MDSARPVRLHVSRHEDDPRRLGSLLSNGLWLGYTSAGPARSPFWEDPSRVRRRAIVAVVWVGLLAGLTIVLGRWIVPLFSSDPALQHDIRAMLPLVAFAVVTDAVQAVYGFGLLGLRRTFPGLVSTAVFFGLLCLVAVPVADAGGLTALWLALGVANLAQAISKAFFFHRLSASTERSPA